MSTEARVADYEREDMLYKEQARLVAELAEARALIATRAFKHGQEIERVRELRAQIAAKDAALREVSEIIDNFLHSLDSYGELERAYKLIGNALSAPAQETNEWGQPAKPFIAELEEILDRTAPARETE